MNQSIAELALAGEVISNTEIIDVHAHLGPQYNFHIPGDPWAAGLVVHMDRIGINVACISPHASLGANPSIGNRQMREAIELYPDRLCGWVGISPHQLEAAEADLERAASARNVVGVKIHPSVHNYPADGDSYSLAWEWASEQNLSVLSHTWGSGKPASPDLFRRWVEKWPQVPLILGHSGGTYDGIPVAADMVRTYPTVYADMCGTFFSCYWPEQIVEMVGPDRLLWGSDMPFHDARHEVGRLALANIEEEVKRKIFSTNFRTLISTRRFSLPA